MQTYDLLMTAVMAGAILFGLWKGFAWQVASLASVVVSYIVARNFAGVVADRIGGDPAWNKFLAMFILFFGCSLAIWIAYGFIRSTIEQMHLKTFDRQVGGALGAFKGALLCIIITLFGVSLFGERACQMICTSRSGNYVAQALAKLHGVVPPEIREYIGPYVDHFNKEIIDHQDDLPIAEQLEPENFQLPFTPPDSIPPGMTWSGNTEQVGKLEPANPIIGNQQRWTGQLERIDWGRAAGQALESIIDGQNRR